jgi:hypothetical protein
MSFVAGTPASLDQIIAKCLSKKPADRYQDALSLLSDLTKVESARANSGEP